MQRVPDRRSLAGAASEVSKTINICFILAFSWKAVVSKWWTSLRADWARDQTIVTEPNHSLSPILEK